MSKKLLFRLFVLLAAMMCALGASAAEAYANYTPSNTTLTFYYDDLRSTRTGTTYDLNTGDNKPDWYSDNTCRNVTQVVINSSFADARPTTTYDWFSGMQNLQSITGMSYLNTSEVTNMNCMFLNCSELTSLDLSSFNTANVTSMQGLFQNCSGLTSLNVSSFNTSNVTTMENLFLNCSSLTSLDVSNFNTAQVTNMKHMFDGCSGLTNLDLSSFNTANVTSMYCMFNNCSSLETLDVSSFNTAQVTNLAVMFSCCSSLTCLDLSSFNTAKVQNMYSMFYYCPALTSVDLSSFNTAKVTIMENMFCGCNSLTSLDVSSFNTARVTSMRSMFNDCSGLTSLDLSNFNTTKVTDMNAMFYRCSDLTTIYVSSKWSTNSVTSSYDMFFCCFHLVGGQGTTYDASHEDASYAHIDGGPKDPGYFTGKGTVPLDGTEAYACYTPSNTTLTFYYDKLRSSREGTTYDLNDPGDVENTEWYNDGSYINVTTVLFDPSFVDARPHGTTSWFQGMENLTGIWGISYLNTSEVTDMSYMFYGCSGLRSINLGDFNTDNVTNMSYMFYNCSGLTRLNPGNFTTCNVTDMSYMFYGCSGLTSLDVSSFNTANVRQMNSMFASCSGLTSLDVSSFNTANVRNMELMFNNCSSLTSLYLSNFNTANVTDMYCMFDGCNGLTSLNLSNFNTANVTNMSRMFAFCSSLTSIHLSNFNTAKVTNMSYMFYGCNGLTSLNLSGFNTARVANMGFMFYCCNALTTIHAGELWSTADVTNSQKMFYECYSLVGGEGTAYSSSHVDKTYAHIDGGTNDPGYFTDIHAGMAYACYTPWNTTLSFYYDNMYDESEGTTYVLNTGYANPGWVSDGTYANVTRVVFHPSFANALPTSTYNWFSGMEELESIMDISNLNTSEVTNMAHMFDGCWNLESLDVSGFNTANVTNMSSMFKDCSGVLSLDVSGFNTARVTNMSNMFYNCSCLRSLDLSGFNTANVTDMSGMFASCGGVLSFNVSNFNTAKVTDMSQMFMYCSRLRILELSNFSTSRVTDMERMFQSCINLHTIYVGDGWSTATVTSSQNMFENSTRIVGGAGTTYRSDHVDKTYAHIDCGTSNPGYFTDINAKMPYTCYTPWNTTLTFYCDTLRATREGMTYDVNTGTEDPGWYVDSTNAVVTRVVFDPSFADARPLYTRYWFCGMAGLESITGISYLNTSEVTNMAHMFDGCSSLETLDVSGFNTEYVTDMSCMFRYCDIVDSLDVSGFNTEYVKFMDNMFYNCYLLRSLDVSGFDTRNVVDMSGMFASCGGVANFDVSGFNTAKVTNMKQMFMYCNGLRSLDLSRFNTAKVTDMEMMFQSCINLSTVNVGDGWSTAAVTSSQNMFLNCNRIMGGAGTTYRSDRVDKEYAHIDGGTSNPGYFCAPPEAYACYTPSNTTLTFYCDSRRGTREGTTYDLNEPGDVCDTGWYNDGSSSHVTTVVFDPSFADARPRGTTSWFQDMGNLTSIIGIEYLNTSEVTDMSWMFSLCWSMETFDLSHFDTHKVTNMSYMFNYCEAMTNIDLSSFDTRNVMYMEGMFYECSALTSLDLSSFYTHNVKSFKEMFFDCAGLSSLDLSSFDTQNAETMNSMFIDCSGLTSINLSSFNTQHVDNMNNMFDGCSSLTSLDLSSFDTEYLLNTEWMFYSCRALKTVCVGEHWDASNVENSDFMFKNCTSIRGGAGTTYDANQIDAAYAHIDGGPSDPGYFTAMVKYDPVMLPADEQYIGLTTFRADWTDETEAILVDNYTLEVVPVFDPVSLGRLEGIDYSYYDMNYSNCTFTKPWGGVNTRIGKGIIYFKNNYDGNATGCLTFTVPDGYTNATFSLVITSGSGDYGAGNFTVYTPQTPAVGHDFVPGETYTWIVTASSGEKITVYTTDENYSPDIAVIEVYLIPCPGQLITGITDKFYTVENLEAGGTYQYRVKTLYTNGTESEWSNVEEVTLSENTHFLRGDVNVDGMIDVSDVTDLISHILGYHVENFNLANAECDNNPGIDISDVTALINRILYGSWE